MCRETATPGCGRSMLADGPRPGGPSVSPLESLMRITPARVAVGAIIVTAVGVGSPAVAHRMNDEGRMSPRTHFVMQPDGSSGSTQPGAGIPNIDSVKSTIRTYYNATGGIADKTASPYIRELARIVAAQSPKVARGCRQAVRRGERPAIVLDADDTTLWTYDMEDKAMNFTFDPALQDVWVQQQKFPATPHMTSLVETARRAGCTVIGLTGRNDDQKAATVANLRKVGYRGFTEKLYFTKWTGKPGSTQPSYIRCAAAKCTTVEYKAQTRQYIEDRLGFTIVTNVGDQFSDLQGGYARNTLKLPNPTYYLP